MANTYTLISSSFPTSGNSVTFSSIPQTYTDLVIRVSGRTTNSSIISSFQVGFNGVTTSTYSSVSVQGNGSAPSSSRSQSNEIYSGFINGGNSLANSFGSSEIYIPNYTNSTNNKQISSFTVSEDNSGTAYITASAGLSSNTAAISSITVYFGGNTIASGSSLYLYGIKNS